MLQYIKEKLYGAWESIKAFFNYSETIVMARLEALTGLIVGAIGFMDLSPLYALFGESAGFSQWQVFWLGATAFIHGILLELARKFRTRTTESGTILPADMKLEPLAESTKKKIKAKKETK